MQLHHLRSEHWFVVSGEGIAFIDGKAKSLHAGFSIDIPKKVKHRVQNSSDEKLIFIEVQIGEYCGDDDIERLEDKYGRV